MPAIPFASATVALVRPRPGGPGPEGPMEVLLTRRPASMAFAGGAFVFPGGKLDPADSAPENLDLVRGMDPERAARILRDGQSPTASLGLWLAGIRELFEETGILLGATAAGREPDLTAPGMQPTLPAGRLQLQRRECTLARLMRGWGLCYRPAALLYLTRWITPAHLPLRFDTRFFLAQAPPGQVAAPCPREVAELRWVEPRAALAAWRAREIRFLSPTVHTLMYLMQYPDCGRLFAEHEEGHLRGRFAAP